MKLSVALSLILLSGTDARPLRFSFFRPSTSAAGARPSVLTNLGNRFTVFKNKVGNFVSSPKTWAAFSVAGAVAAVGGLIAGAAVPLTEGKKELDAQKSCMEAQAIANEKALAASAQNSKTRTT